MKIKIENIKINPRLRKIDQSKVIEIAESIREIGLLNPINVSEAHELIAGLHRLKACVLLGYTDIEANIVNLDGLKQELAEIDENLIRAEIHFIEKGDQLKRRKEIYQELYPETKVGISQAAGMNKTIGNNISAESALTFVQDTAAKSGISTRVIHEEIQIATNLSPEMKEAIKANDITKTDAITIARLSPEDQKEVLDDMQKSKDSVKRVMERLVTRRKTKAIKEELELEKAYLRSKFEQEHPGVLEGNDECNIQGLNEIRLFIEKYATKKEKSSGMALDDLYEKVFNRVQNTCPKCGYLFKERGEIKI